MQPVKIQSRYAIERGSPKYDHVHGVSERWALAPGRRAAAAVEQGRVARLHLHAHVAGRGGGRGGDDEGQRREGDGERQAQGCHGRFSFDTAGGAALAHNRPEPAELLQGRRRPG